jgi:hypothetical protein
MSTCRIGKAVTLDNGEVINEQMYKIRHKEGLDGYETQFEHLPECDLGPEP